MQEPGPPPAPVAPDVHITNLVDLSGLASGIWTWLLEHLPQVGQTVQPHLPAIGEAVWSPASNWFESGLRNSAQAVWTAAWGSSANIVTQLPASLTYEFGPLRAIAVEPFTIAIGGATLALVLLGLRMMLGSIIGKDHLVSHILTRLIPAVFLTLAYPVFIARGFSLLNQAATSLGSVEIGQALAFGRPTDSALAMPYALLWLLLIYYAVRLLIRLAYSLFRLLVALLFGPVALILWAIPQTEWITHLWLGELLGWATTPLLVTACLALALPLASGQAGFLGAAVFGIDGLQAAYDLTGFLSSRRARGGSLFPSGAIRSAAFAAAGGAGAAAATASSARTPMADFGHD